MRRTIRKEQIVNGNGREGNAGRDGGWLLLERRKSKKPTRQGARIISIDLAHSGHIYIDRIAYGMRICGSVKMILIELGYNLFGILFLFHYVGRLRLNYGRRFT